MKASIKNIPSVRVPGLFAIIASIVFLFLFAANVRSRIYYHGPNYGSLFWVFLYLAITGAGLLRLKKWAVLLSFAPGLVSGAILAASLGTMKGSLLALLFNITLVAFLVAVPVRMLRYWDALSW